MPGANGETGAARRGSAISDIEGSAAIATTGQTIPVAGQGSMGKSWENATQRLGAVGVAVGGVRSAI